MASRAAHDGLVVACCRAAQQVPPVAELVLAGLGAKHGTEQRQILLLDLHPLHVKGWLSRQGPGTDLLDNPSHGKAQQDVTSLGAG